MDFTPQRFGFLQMNQYDLEDLHSTRIQHTDGGCAAILDLVHRLKLIGNISVASMQRPDKFGRNRSNCAEDITDFCKSKMAAVAAILDLVQRLKLIGNISVASVRRPAKFGRNRSSCAGDITDFGKSKMAAVPPFWI